jgi:hypothetical protein
MKLISDFCKWYMGRQMKVAQQVQKKIQDKKLEEAGAKLKDLYEFVKLVNEKILRNRHERKTFWRNVEEGRPMVEDTLLNLLRNLGVKEESIKAIQQAKIDQIEKQKLEEQKRRDLARTRKEQEAKNLKTCPTDCSADCSKCANAPKPSEALKNEQAEQNREVQKKDEVKN